MRTMRFVILFLLLVALAGPAFPQGKGRGGGSGGGRGSGGGGGHGGGPPDGVGVNRGIETSSDRSNGRADTGRANASTHSNGRSDVGLTKAQRASENLNRADRELREHPGVASTLRLNARDLRSQYQTALLTNPDLKFGHFVSATRVSQNLSRRNPAITRDAILAGLASGRSLGQTLQDLGLNEQQANEARKQAEREIKNGRKQ